MGFPDGQNHPFGRIPHYQDFPPEVVYQEADPGCEDRQEARRWLLPEVGGLVVLAWYSEFPAPPVRFSDAS